MSGSLGMAVETICTPGAWMSTHVPLLEKSASLLEMSTAPTVNASGDLAGEIKQASPPNLPSFPAATTTNIPSSTAR